MSFGIWEILILLLIVVLLFGTKRFRTIGSDLGAALKGFKKEMNTDEAKDSDNDADFAKVDDKASQSTSQTAETKQNKE